eukprot:1580204-Prymnesium_polylepis.1
MPKVCGAPPRELGVSVSRSLCLGGRVTICGLHQTERGRTSLAPLLDPVLVHVACSFIFEIL